MSNTHINSININLTQEQKLKLRNLHRESRDRLVCDRIRCVLLCNDGWTQEMISRSQLIHETTVSRHLNDWLNGEKLAPENGGSASHLSKEQTAELVTYLTNNLLPTTQAIIERVAEWWGIRYTVPGMTKWLHRKGFSYRKPMGVPHKFSAETQRAFVETYNALKQKAGDDEPILFIDCVHPTQGTKLAYGWMLAGKNAQPVETTGSRTRLNIGYLEKPRRLHFLFLKTLVYCSIWVFCEHIKYKKQTISFGPDLISRRDLTNMRFFEVPYHGLRDIALYTSFKSLYKSISFPTLLFLISNCFKRLL